MSALNSILYLVFASTLILSEYSGSTEVTKDEIDPRCPPNRVYRDCKCKSEGHPSDSTTVCPGVCIEECVCKPGFVPGRHGSCIRPKHNSTSDDEQEPQKEWGVERSSVNPLSYTDEGHYFPDGTTEKPLLRSSRQWWDCPANQHYSLCDANCQKTCDNYNKPIPCPRLCIWGCVCNLGLIRGPDRKCIKPEKCPTKPQAEAQRSWCGEHEVWDYRYAHCPRNCSNFDDILRCRNVYVAGCVCDYAYGYVRGPNGKCIAIEKCPNKTVIHTSEEYLNTPEIYSNTDETSNPTPYTDDDYHISESVSTVHPISGIENSQFEEIPTKSKPDPSHKCPPRHRWVVCGAHCQRNCSNKDDNDFRCRPVCIPGCICKKGLVKGPDGECIEKDKCPETSDSEKDPYVTLNPPPYTDDDHLIPETVTEIPRNSETENLQLEEIPPTSHSSIFRSGGCPSSYDCTNYCKKRGKKVGSCQGFQRMECLCFDHW